MRGSLNACVNAAILLLEQQRAQVGIHCLLEILILKMGRSKRRAANTSLDSPGDDSGQYSDGCFDGDDSDLRVIVCGCSWQFVKLGRAA